MGKNGNLGNRNHLVNGLHSYLTTGRLPVGASYVARLVNKFRRELERAVLDREKEVDLFAAALIQSACRHEARALLLLRWLRERQELTVDQSLSIVRDIGAASDARDKCLRQLGLDKRQPVDPFAELYSGQLNNRISSPLPSASGPTGRRAVDATQDAAANEPRNGEGQGEANHDPGSSVPAGD